MNANQTINKYRETVSKAFSIVEKVLNDESKKLAKKQLDGLSEKLGEDVFIKVPMIGDFSVGKSSLINAFIDRNELLPTGIRPETAVSYEMYYAPSEFYEHIRDGKVIAKEALSQLTNDGKKPGDIIKVFVDNPKIKQLTDKNIALVDMPGFDSGLDAHNKAIMNYVSEGVGFIVLVDVEQGTLRGSNLTFIKEIQQYGLDINILISKADKKSEEEAEKVRSYISEQAQKYLSNNSTVALVSAPKKRLEALEQILSNLDGAKLAEQKLYPLVESYINGLIQDVHKQSEIIDLNVVEVEESLNKLKIEKERAIQTLARQSENSATMSSQSAGNILYDVKSALIANESKLVTLLMRGRSAEAQLAHEVTSIIRPVMINGLKKEGETLATKLQGDLTDVLSSIDAMIGSNGSNLPMTKDDILAPIMQIKPIADTIFKDNKTYKSIVGLLGLTTSVVAPWVEVVLLFLPEILSFFGASNKEEQIKEQYTEAFHAQFIPNVGEKLQGQIEQALEVQNQNLIAEAKEKLNEEMLKLEDTFNTKKVQLQNNISDVEKEKVVLAEAQAQLQSLLA